MNETSSTRVHTPENLVEGETYLLRTPRGLWMEGSFVDVYLKRRRLKLLFENVRLFDDCDGWMQSLSVYWPVEIYTFEEVE